MLEDPEYAALAEDAATQRRALRNSDDSGAADDASEDLDPFEHLHAAAAVYAAQLGDEAQSGTVAVGFPGERLEDDQGEARLKGSLMRPCAPRMQPAELDACVCIHDSAAAALPEARARFELDLVCTLCICPTSCPCSTLHACQRLQNPACGWHQPVIYNFGLWPRMTSS